jgi:RNA polymerase sigma-70 factor (ECF subfamily)
MDEPSTTTLVRDFAAGRREAFRTLHRRIAPRLYLWCSLRVPMALRPRFDPEDLLQEIWLRAVRAMPRFDRAAAPFRAWLFGIAANTLAESLRNSSLRQREKRLAPDAGFDDLPADVTSVIQQVARRETVQRLVAACDSLAAEDRQLLLLRGIEGLPHADVARQLGIQEATAEMRWRRLVQRLRQQWSAAGFDDAELP